MATEAGDALAAGFPAATTEEWHAAVDKVLKGAPFSKLVSRTADGIEVQPLYVADGTADPAGFPGSPPFTRGAAAAPPPEGAWDVRATLADAAPADAARAALRELERGATSLVVRLDEAFRSGGAAGVDGVAVTSVDDLDAALEGVYLDLAPVHLVPGAAFEEAADLLVALWARRGVDAATVRGGVGADPVGTLATTGEMPEDALDRLGALAGRLAVSHPGAAVASVDTSAVAEAGASPAQELGYLLATGAAYLRAMAAAGVPVDAAVRAVVPTVTVDADVFGGIAKLRAARRLWSHLTASCGATVPPEVHARTASHMMTRVDPWVNLLRVTAATFAAGVGGAQSLVTQPFDAAVGVPDELGRRMARNTQVILQEESNVGRVVDPAGGSWYVEALTDQLAAAGWAAYVEVAGEGGVVASLRSGALGGRIAEVRTGRQGLVARRRAPITGVSEFPDIAEEPVVRPPAAAPARPVADGPLPLPVVRWAEPFEALRDAATAAAEPPQVFLVNLGPVAVHTARATFAKNFFEAGGIAAVTSARGATTGFDDPADAVADLSASGARLVCICSSDDRYAAAAETFAAALRDAGAGRVYLAGNPGDRRAAEEAAGVDEFVHLGVDVLDVLGRAHAVLGTPRTGSPSTGSPSTEEEVAR